MEMDDAGADDWHVTAVAINAANVQAEMQMTWFGTGQNLYTHRHPQAALRMTKQNLK